MTMEEIEAMLGNNSERHGGGHVSGSVASGSRSAPPEVPEDVIAAVASELDDLKANLGAFREGGSYFKIRVLGRASSATLTKMPATDAGAYPVDKSTELWCRAVGWSVARSFALSKYGHDNARNLVEEMCRRFFLFVRSWISAGSPVPFSFEAIKDGYQEVPEYVQWFEDLPLNSEACRAAFKLRDLCPKSVPA